jgi:1,4-dihydroxy-2-naphthoyl-CoA hydrolase
VFDRGRLATTLEDVLGFQLLEATETHAVGTVACSDRIKQHMGVVHGGVYAALAESVASHATFRSVRDEGLSALGLSNMTSFLRPIDSGTVTARAERVHRGRTTWVWEVRISDDHGRLCALSRVTVAVRAGGALGRGSH